MKILRSIADNTKSVCAILAICGIIAYSPSLMHNFSSLDDSISIVNNPTVKNISGITKVFSSSFFDNGTYYRPLVLTSFMAEYHLSKANPMVFHLDNIFIHIAVAIMIYLLFCVLCERKYVAFIISLLYVFHPASSEAVMEISCRPVLLCALFYISSFYFYVLFSYKKEKAVNILYSVFFFALALLSWEPAVTLPLVIMSFEVIYAKEINTSRDPKGYLIRTVPYFFVLIIYFYLRQVLGATHIEYWDSFRDMGLGIATFLRAVFSYLRLIILPYDLHVFRAAEYFSSFTNVELTVTFFVFMALLGTLISVRKRLQPVHKICLMWVFLTLIPFSQIIPIRAHMHTAALYERFLYIPAVGILALLVMYIDYLLDLDDHYLILPRKQIKLISLGFFVAFFVITFNYNAFCIQESEMLSRSLLYDPGNTRTRAAYALSLSQEGNFDQAEEQFRRILEKEPWNTEAKIGLGKSLIDQGKIAQGVLQYEQIKDADKYKGLIDEELAYAYKMLINKYKELLVFDFENPETYFKLGITYAKVGRTGEAIEEFKKAILLYPEYKSALFNLAVAYEKTGEKGLAIVNFEKVVNIKGPKDTRDKIAYERLYELYLGFKDYIKADEYMREGKKLGGRFRQPKL